jgi:SPP1 gp7 family putative phage head morphogenesis protein
MKIKNETEIQLMKILFKTSGKKPTKNITSRRAYPYGIEKKYSRQLQFFFKPLTDYVENFINQNMEPLLRGDSKDLHLDAIPGDTFRNMIYNLENWLSVYMPDISELPEDKNNNVILAALGKTADEAMEFGNKEFSKMLDKGIHVNLPTSASWWNNMKNSWAQDNYTLITSNAKKYVSKINTLTEQAIVNGMSPKKLKDEIYKATEGLTQKHCKLIARDQMGKLNGQITQAQMQEIGLDYYVWSTAFDDRVRDSHAAMEGLLCRWDDASVCSYDGGKTWVDRPANAVQLHPGQDIQCRCVGLAYYPELTAEIEGKPIEYIPASETLESVSNFETITDKIDRMKVSEEGEIKNIIPLATAATIKEATKIYNKQKATGTEIYVEKMVDLDKIVTEKKLLNKEKLLETVKSDKLKTKNKLIRAVEFSGFFLLIDGIYQVAKSILEDNKRIKIAVLNPVEE